MRRFPSSWDKTLAALGFRRNVKRIKREFHRTNGIRIESLERREMLSVSPNEGDYKAVPTTELNDVTLVESIRPEYVLADSAAGDTPEQFEITTEYSESGQPTAVITLKEGLERIDRSLQELTVELRLGQSVLARHEVLIDIAESRFVHDFQSARIADLPATTETEVTDTKEWVTRIDAEGRFEDLGGPRTSLSPALQKVFETQFVLQGGVQSRLEASNVSSKITAEETAETLDRFSKIANQQAADPTLLASADDRVNFYKGLEQTLAKTAAPQRDLASDQEDAERLDELALALGKQLQRDLSSDDAAVVESATKARAELLSKADPYYTMLNGFEKNHELESRAGSDGSTEFAINIVEEGTLAIDDTIRVELGDYDAMVQTQTSWLAGASQSLRTAALSVDVGTLRDATIDLLNQTANDNGSSLSVGASGGGGAFVESGGLVSFEAENYHSKLVGATDDWTVESDQTGYTGTGFVHAGPDDGTLYGTSPGYLSGSPRLDYQVDFAAAGTYYVWVRGMKADGSSDSVHVGLDGQANTTADRIQVLGNGFNWNQGRVGGGIATLVVPSAGVHTVNIWMREDGVRIDKLVVTDDANYTPTGNGPAESASSGGATSDTLALLGFDLTQYAGTVPQSATLTLDTESTSGVGADISVAAHSDLWKTSETSAWDEATVTGNEYTSELQAGFGATLDTQTATAGSTVSLDVTEAVQRTLLLGDSNFSSDLDWRGAAGDVEAFYLAATDDTAYRAKYAGLDHAAVADDFLYRNDANVDGVVDSNDVAPYLQRMGIGRGDFNLDGTVDGYDYSVWSANFGASADRFGMGDANADGYIGPADYTVWNDSFGELGEAPTSPEATFRLVAENGDFAQFASDETTTGTAPELTVDLASRTVVQSFDTVEGDLRVTYENQHESPVTPTMAIYQVVDGVRTPIASGLAISAAIGVHQEVINLPAPIVDPGEAYELVAEIETDGVARSWRSFDGGVFETSDGKVHAHGTEGDDSIVYDQGTLTVSNATGFTADYALGGSGSSPYAESGGIVAFEAEDYHDKLVGATDEWTVESDQTGYTGTGFVHAGPDDGTLYGTSPGYLSGSPRLDYQVDFAAAGTYYVWVRGMKADGSSDSVHVGLDGQANTTADRIQVLGTGFNWNQGRVGGGIATLVVPSAGVHTVNIWMREDGVRIDKLIVTDDANYTPTGDGPTVSAGGPSTGGAFTGEAYLHALGGDDTLALEQHTGASFHLVGGYGDDLYELAAVVDLPSSVELHDEGGLEEIKFTGWGLAGEPSNLISSDTGVAQSMFLAGSVSPDLTATIQPDAFELFTELPTSSISSGGYNQAIEVTDTTDTADLDSDEGTSLREALSIAYAINGDLPNAIPSLIVFNLDEGDDLIELTHRGGQEGQDVLPLQVDSNVGIVGPGADLLTIDGNGAEQTLSVTGGSVGIEDLSVTGASDAGVHGVIGGALSLEGVAIHGNANGIVVGDTTLNIQSSAIHSNTGGDGIHADGGWTAIVNSTVSGNAQYGVRNTGFNEVAIFNATVVDNGQLGVSLDSSDTASFATISNSIILGNATEPGYTQGDLYVASALSLSGSHNLLATGAGHAALSDTVFATDLSAAGVDGVLRNNGGTTPTHALLVGSSALDAGGATSLQTDQRGPAHARVVDNVIDIGAYEAGDSSADIVTIMGGPSFPGRMSLWYRDVLQSLESSLSLSGASGNRYSLVSFDHQTAQQNGPSIQTLVNGQSWGNYSDLSNSIVLAYPDGDYGVADAYEAIQMAIEDFDFRAKSPVNFILLTEEHERNVVDPSLTPEVLLDLLLRDPADSSDDVLLNSVLYAALGQSGPSIESLSALGIDSEGFAYFPDGEGGHETRTGYSLFEWDPSNSVLQDFADPVLQSGGAVFTAYGITGTGGYDFGGNQARSFTSVFTAIKTREVTGTTTLEEDFRLVTEHVAELDVAWDAVVIEYDSLTFDSTAGNPGDQNDAFEIALVDEDGNPARVSSSGPGAIGTISDGSDALFNISQGQQPVWATGVDGSGVGANSGSIKVDLRGLDPTHTYEVVYRLVNNDADDNTQVTIPSNPVTSFTIDPGSDPFPDAIAASAPATAQAVTDALGVINYSGLQDLTSDFEIDYQLSTVADGQLTAETLEFTTRLQLQKLSGRQARGELLLAILPPAVQDGAIDPGATWLGGIDGLGRLPYEAAGLPSGTAFIRLTGEMESVNGFYTDGGVVSDVELVFEHEKNDRFDFELVVLGELNDAPAFTSDPYAERRGQAYPVDFLEGSVPVPMLELVAARDNEFRYTPSAVDPNGDRYRIEVVGGPDGGTDDTTLRAIDADEDGRNDTVVWAPDPTTQIGTHTVTIRVIDEHDLYSAANDQTFLIRVVEDAFNRPPTFETPPKTLATYGEDYRYDANAFDPDGHALSYEAVATPVRPMAYTALSIADLGLTAGDTISHLTFLNYAGGAEGVSMFSNVRITESDWPGEALPLRFEEDRFTDYGANVTSAPQVTGDLSVVRFEVDAQVAYSLPVPYVVTENTVLSFDFSSETQGDSHGIGVAADGEIPGTINNARWFRVYGNDAGTPGVTTGITADVNPYTPEWSVDQSDNFLVDPDTGVVTWTGIPYEAAGSWVHVDLRVKEIDDPLTVAMEDLTAHQSYQLYVQEPESLPDQLGEVDLSVAFTAESTSALTIDGQTLEIAGVITAAVSNLGDGQINGPFEVTFFEDLDFDGFYTPGRDNVLGKSAVTQSLGPADDEGDGDTITVAAPLSGQVLFGGHSETDGMLSGTVIYAFVDSGDAIVEANEENNHSGSSDDCQAVPSPGFFTPQIERSINQEDWPDVHVYEDNDPDDLLGFDEQFYLPYSLPAIGDIDLNGTPDIVLHTYGYRGDRDVGAAALHALSGVTGDWLWDVADSGDPDSVFHIDNWLQDDYGIAIGDVDGDGFLEIAAVLDNGQYALFSHEGKRESYWNWGSSLRSHDNGNDTRWSYPAIADLDGDGNPEIIFGGTVLNSDGTLRWRKNIPNALPIVADLNMDGNSEVILGNQVFDKDGQEPSFWSTAGLDNGFPLVGGRTAVANLDDDTDPELVVVYDRDVYVLEHNGALKADWPIFHIDDVFTPVSDVAGQYGGPPVVADFDGDGENEIGVSGEDFFYVIDGDGSQVWTYPIEENSGGTGAAVFDFEGDGRPEILLRDARALHAFRVPAEGGGDQLEPAFTPILLSAHTQYEYPVIADVDGDGSAEIIVGADVDQTELVGEDPDLPVGLYVFGDPDNLWRDASEIWNQHSYHITNINADGSIPTNEEPSWLAHNTYRTNADPEGSGLRDAPDLVASYLRAEESASGTTLTVRIGNGGSAFAREGVTVRFIDGPIVLDEDGATVLGEATLSRLERGEYQDVSITPLVAFDLQTVTVVVDPIDDVVAAPDGFVTECREDNNTYSISTGTHVNSDPILDYEPLTVLLDGTAYSDKAVANDVDAPEIDTLVYSLPLKPEGMWIDPLSGEIGWEPTASQRLQYSHPVVVAVEDGHNGFDSLYFQIRPQLTNADPILAPIDDLTVTTLETLTVPFKATDPDGGDLLTFSWQALTPLPEGESLFFYEAADYLTTGNVDLVWSNPVAGSYEFEAIVEDGRRGRDRQIFTVTVYEGTENQPPIFDTLEPVAPAAFIEEEWAWSVFARDTIDGMVWTSDAVGVPEDFVVKLDAASQALGFTYSQDEGVVRWTPTNEINGTLNLSATDPEGYTSGLSLSIPVNVRTVPVGQNEPARITSELQQTTAMAGRLWTYRIEAEDLDRDDVMIKVESFTDRNGADLLLGDTILPGTGTGEATLFFSKLIPNSAEGPLTLVVSADDDIDNDPGGAPDHRYTYTIGLRENSPPMLTRSTSRVDTVLGSAAPNPIEFDLIDFDGDDVLIELVSPSSIRGEWKSSADLLTAQTISGMVTDTSTDPDNPTELFFEFTPEVAGLTTATFRISDGVNPSWLKTVEINALLPTLDLSFEVEARNAASLDAEYVAQATRTDNSSINAEFAFMVDGVPTTEIVYAAGEDLRPVGMRIDPETGRITWSPEESQLTQPGEFPYEFTVALIDTNAVAPHPPATSDPLSVVVVSRFENFPPTIQSDPTDHPFSLTNPFVYPLVGKDPENDPLRWDHVSGPGNLDGEVFTWTPTAEDLNKTQYVVIQVHDPYGPGELQTIELSLNGSELPPETELFGNKPPRITSTPTRPGKAGQVYTYTVRGEDDDDHAFGLIKPAAIDESADLDWLDNGDGTFTFQWTIPANPQPVTVAFDIVDEKGLRGATQEITFVAESGSGTGSVDTPVKILSAPPHAVAVGSSYTPLLDAVDPDGPISFAITERRLLQDGDESEVANLTIDSVDGDFSWTPGVDAIGVYEITVVASQDGATATVSFPLEVFDPGTNLAPKLDSIDPQTVTLGKAFAYQATGSDDGPYEFYLLNEADEFVREHNGVKITANGLITWAESADADAVDVSDTKDVRVRVLDDADRYSMLEEFTITVVEDQAPTAILLASPRRQEPDGTVLLTALAEDDLGIVDLRLVVTKTGGGYTEELDLSSNETAIFSIPTGATAGDVYTATLTAFDAAAHSVVATVDITVREANLAAPRVQVTSPDGYVLEEPLDLAGWIVDENLVYYAITAVPSGGGAPIILKEQEIQNTGDTPLGSIGAVDSPATLLTINPVTLPDGVYDIVVTARDDAGEETSDTVFYQIRSQTKLGNFQLSFTDLTVPVAGFPLSVVRTYDSNDVEQDGEFGVGWSLDVVSGEMTYLSAGGFDDFDSFTYGQQPMYGGSVVTLELPGGGTHRFTVVPINPDTTGGPFSAGIIDQVGLAFRPEAGQASTLEFVPRDSGQSQYDLQGLFYPSDFEFLLTEQQYLDKYTGVIGKYQEDGSFVSSSGANLPINPSTLNANYKLTTRSGVEYIFDSTTYQLIEATDLDGNRVEFRPNRYTAFNGDGFLMGELTVERQNGRITAIGDESGARVVYQYDTDGRLEKFWDRTVSGQAEIADAVPTAEFFYGEDDYSETGVQVHPDVLTSIRGASARPDEDDARTLKVGWNDEGRISKLEDASGAAADFTYNIDLGTELPGYSSERILDAERYIDGVEQRGATELLRDPSGNVVRQLQRVDGGATPELEADDSWLITAYFYDGEDRQVGETTPFTLSATADRFMDWPADWAAEFGSDDPIVDPDLAPGEAGIWQSLRKYDSNGNLVVEMDSAGLKTRYSGFNERYGFAAEVEGPQGKTLTSSTSFGLGGVSRIQTTTQLNASGEDSVTELLFLGPNLEKVSQGDDANDTEAVTSLSYDTQWRLNATTDASGQITRFVYDANDNQVLSYSVWEDPDGNDDYTIVNETVYDAENRVTESRQYEISHLANGGPPAFASQAAFEELNLTPTWSTATDYNAAGQVVRTVDRNGAESFTLYDVRGNVVETRTETHHPNTVVAASGGKAWIVSRTAYDVNGLAIAATDPFVVHNDLSPLDPGFDPTPEQGVTLDPTLGHDVVIRADGTAWLEADYRATHTLYDTLGRVIETRRLAGAAISLDRVVGADDPENNLYGSTFAVYDGQNDSYISGASPLSVSKTDYDTQGRVDWTSSYAVDDQAGTEVHTYFKYDPVGRQVEVATVYDTDGNQGVEVTHDASPELAGQTFPLLDEIDNDQVFVTKTEYDSSTGRQSATIDANGTRTEFVYDDLGRVIETIADAADGGLQVRTNTTYDHAGRQLTSTDALRQTTVYGYDDATGQLTSVALPRVNDGSTGSTTGQAVYEYGYDEYGNQTSITDPRDNVTEFEFDHRGRQTKRTQPLGVASELVAGDFVERMFYDDTPLATLGYGTVGGGQLAFSVDFEGRITQYLYDNSPEGRGRLVEEHYYSGSGGPAIDDVTSTAMLTALLTNPDDSIEHQYDALGRLVETKFTLAVSTLSEEVRTTIRTYDIEGRQTQVVTEEGTINYAHDTLGRLEQTSTGNSTIDYGYDPLGRLKTVTVVKRGGQSAGGTTTYAYDAVGNLDLTIGPDDVVSDYQYDALNRLELLRHYKDNNDTLMYEVGADQLFAEYDYFLRDDGRRSGVVETDATGPIDEITTIDWAYDEMGRLVEERYNAEGTSDDFIARYGYDLGSNRVRFDKDLDTDLDSAAPGSFSANETTTYGVDANDRLLSETTTDAVTGGPLPSTTYSYDNPSLAGTDARSTKQTLKEVDGDTHAYEYDNQGRLSKVTITPSGDSPTTTTYRYDANGVRVSQTTGGETTEYLIDASNPTGYAKAIEDYVDGVLTRSYAFGHAVLSQGYHGAKAELPDSEVRTFLHDGHGSTRFLLGTASVVDQAYDYDAFGKLIGQIDEEAAMTAWLFAGDGIYDRASGLTQHLDRWRSGHVFLSVDAYPGSSQDPISFHKYLYGHGDLINNTDPTGHVSLAEVNVAVKANVGNFTLVTSAVGNAFTAANGVVNAIQTIQFIATVANTGIIDVLRKEFENYFSTLSSSSAPEVKKLFSDSFWKDAVQSMVQNGTKIASEIVSRKAVGKGIATILTKNRKPRFVILLPIPDGLPLNQQRPIKLPISFSFAGKQVGLSIQIGRGPKKDGAVWGLGLQGNAARQVQPIFRMDYHPFHVVQPGDVTRTERWPDSSNSQFHYHVYKQV